MGKCFYAPLHGERAAMSASQVIAASTTVAIQFDNESFDTQSDYDTTQPMSLQLPKDGIYRIKRTRQDYNQYDIH